MPQSSSKKSNPLMGLPFFFATLILALLKVTGVIAWTWLWVLSPIWIIGLLGNTFVLIAVLILGVTSLFESR